MELNIQKDKIQDQAVEKWGYAAKIGTIQAITGIGKTFIFLKALMTMPRHQLDRVHLFLAETTSRDRDLQEDIKKFNKIYNVDILALYNLQFRCYQEVYKWKGYKFGLVCADEIHDSLTTEYVKFYINNEYDAILGLSALIESTQQYTIKRDIPLRNYFGVDMLNKHEMIARIAPICFKYDINQGQLDDTSRKLNIYVIKNQLDKDNKTILGGNEHSRFYQTEESAYGYTNKLVKDALALQPKDGEDYVTFEERRQLKIIQASNKRSKLLYSLPSKVEIVKTLLKNIKSKTIIFSNHLDTLLKMTPNVISSRNSHLENEAIRNNFDKDIITTIGSFKKLKQGANLPKLDNCIITSYYSSEKDIIQMFGRLRQNEGKVGNVFIIVTEGTQEVVWFNKMTQNITEYNVIVCDSVDDCITKYKAND